MASLVSDEGVTRLSYVFYAVPNQSVSLPHDQVRHTAMMRSGDPNGATHRIHNPDPPVARVSERHSAASGRAAFARRLKLNEQHLVRVVETPHSDQHQRMLSVRPRALKLAGHQSPREPVSFATRPGRQFDRCAVGGA